MKKLQVALMGTTLAVALAVSGGSAYAAKGMVAAPAPAAMSGLYVSVFGGIALPTNATGVYHSYYPSYSVTIPLSSGFLIGGAIGTQIMDNARAELELSFANHGVGSPVTNWDSTYTGTGTVSTLFALGNIWFDINTGSGITPYIGGGAGIAMVMPNVNIDSGYIWNKAGVAPAAQFGAGVKIPVADNMAIDLGYRAKAVFSHVWQNDISSSASYSMSDMNWLDQTVQAGLTVALP